MPQIPDDGRMHEQVLARAGSDPEFRARLLRDPRAAIREAFGVAIPPDFSVKFVERERGVDALVVLPPPTVGAEGELSEDELEEVAGGTGGDEAFWSEEEGETEAE